MIDEQTARDRVVRFLSSLERIDDDPWVIDDVHTREYETAWLFFWTREAFLKTGERQYEVVCNYPILVDKEEGHLYCYTMLYPLEPILERLKHDKASLPRLDRPVNDVSVSKRNSVPFP